MIGVQALVNSSTTCHQGPATHPCNGPHQDDWAHNHALPNQRLHKPECAASAKRKHETSPRGLDDLVHPQEGIKHPKRGTSHSCSLRKGMQPSADSALKASMEGKESAAAASLLLESALQMQQHGGEQTDDAALALFSLHNIKPAKESRLVKCELLKSEEGQVAPPEPVMLICADGRQYPKR